MVEELQIDGRQVQIIHMSTKATHASWWEPWLATGKNVSKLAEATVEKLVCAKANVFWGTDGSSFSKDIERLRWGFQTAQCNDGKILHEESPWANATSHQYAVDR